MHTLSNTSQVRQAGAHAFATQQTAPATQAADLDWDGLSDTMGSDAAKRELQLLRTTFLDVQQKLADMTKVCSLLLCWPTSHGRSSSRHVCVVHDAHRVICLSSVGRGQPCKGCPEQQVCRLNVWPPCITGARADRLGALEEGAGPCPGVFLPAGLHQCAQTLIPWHRCFVSGRIQVF